MFNKMLFGVVSLSYFYIGKRLIGTEDMFVLKSLNIYMWYVLDCFRICDHYLKYFF